MSHSDSAIVHDEYPLRYLRNDVLVVSCAKTKRWLAKCITGKFLIAENAVFENEPAIGTEY